MYFLLKLVDIPAIAMLGNPEGSLNPIISDIVFYIPGGFLSRW